MIKNILLGIAAVLTILLLSGLAIKQCQTNRQLQSLIQEKNSKLMEADLTIGRAQTEIVSLKKVHSIALANIDKKWKEEIKKREALVVLYVELQAKYEAEKLNIKVKTKVVYIDRVTTEPVEIPVGKLFIKKANGDLEEAISLPWKYSDFRIDLEGDALNQTLSYKLHQRFRLQFIETKLLTGARNHYAKLWELDDKGNKLKELTVTKFEVIRGEELPDKMFWWNPKLDLGIHGGITTSGDGTVLFDLGLSTSSYGKTPNDIFIRFFRLSAQYYLNGFSVGFSPVQYNLGRHLPLVSNLWITPNLSYAPVDKVGIFSLGLSVVF